MHKYLLFLAVPVVLGLTTNSSAQSKSNQKRMGEVPFAASSNPSRDPATGTRHNSAQVRALAKQSYEMGVKYARAGLYEQAAQSFEKAVQFDPTYADAHYGLGNAYLDLKEWLKAVKSFENAVRFNARNEEAHTKLAEARLKFHIASSPPRQSENTTRKTKTSLSAASSPPSDAANPLGDVNRSQANASRSPKDENISLSDAGNSPRNVGNSPSNAGGPVGDASRSESNENNSVADNSVTAKAEDDPTRIYRVGIGDVLDVRLGDAVPAQSTLFSVTASGLLEHPNLVEPLPVSGLTIEEIKMRLEEDLKRRAITDEPKVAVSIREYMSHAILVSGLVKEPGTKLLRREAIPLYVVVADAQPLPEAGRLTLIQNEGRNVLNIDLDPGQMNILVRSGDVITVQRNPMLFFYLGGEVKSPGEKPFRPGLTLTQAILVAEGLTSKGKEAHLAREKADGFLQVTRYKLKDINSGKLEDPLIQPGDRITIVD